MNLKLITIFCASVLCLSCATKSTPANRIEQNTTLFEKQPAAHRSLIRNGEIKEGMSKNAVWLAWGEPDSKYESYRDGKAQEQWDYTALKTIQYTEVDQMIGFGTSRRSYNSSYGRCHRDYDDCWSTGVSTTFEQVPVHAASVWFKNNRVESWERKLDY